MPPFGVTNTSDWPLQLTNGAKSSSRDEWIFWVRRRFPLHRLLADPVGVLTAHREGRHGRPLPDHIVVLTEVMGAPHGSTCLIQRVVFLVGDGQGRRSGGRMARNANEEVLVGRATEHAVAERAVERALDGAPQLLVIEGEPGVGKSALARAVAAMLPADAITLWARGDELERQLDFGIVDQLLREAAAAGLASPPALHRDGTRPDPLAVGEIVLGLVEDHGRERALLVVVDDAQWADLASVQALSFATRRLHDRRAALLIVQRPTAPGLEPFQRLACATGAASGCAWFRCPSTPSPSSCGSAPASTSRRGRPNACTPTRAAPRWGPSRCSTSSTRSR